jgi:hypothetical protein
MPSQVFETEARWGFSQVRPMRAYRQSVEAEREKPRRARGSDDGAGIHESSAPAVRGNSQAPVFSTAVKRILG